MRTIKTMRTIRRTIGNGDKYHRGRVVHIDFTYVNHLIVWVQFKTKTVAYLYIEG